MGGAGLAARRLRAREVGGHCSKPLALQPIAWNVPRHRKAVTLRHALHTSSCAPFTPADSSSEEAAQQRAAVQRFGSASFNPNIGFSITMKNAFLFLVLTLAACGAAAEACEQASREYDAANSAPVRDKDLVERVYRRVQAACGNAPGQTESYAPPPAMPARAGEQAPGRTPPARCVNGKCPPAQTVR